MNADLPIVIDSDSENGPVGTAAKPIPIDSDSEDETEQMRRDKPYLKEFTLFDKLPIELKLNIWNHAFPPRVVNLIYDSENKYCISFNSSPPLLLHIHKESRQLALRTYKKFFPNTWINFARDILLLDDDWLSPPSVCPHRQANYPFSKMFRKTQRCLVQNIAVRADHLQHHCPVEQIRALTTMVKIRLEQYKSVKKLFILYEDGLNPWSRGNIRFFPIERQCLATCDSKACANLAKVRAHCQVAIDALRSSEMIVWRGIEVNFVGAWRGGTREEVGHALDGYDSESGDESYDPADEPADGYGPDMVEMPNEADVETTFSDHEGWEMPDFVSEQEVWDLQKDEQNYQESLEREGNSYESKQGQTLLFVKEKPSLYYDWRKEQGGKLFPIYHPDGSYKAV